MLDKINNIVEKYISECELVDMDDFIFLNRLIDIYDRHFTSRHIYKYKERIPFKKSFEYSYNFFMSINPEYAEYLKARYLEGAFELDYQKENRDSFAISYTKNGKNKIYIPVQENIDDSYTISHEIIHDMTIENGLTINRTLFCEVFSLLTEELQCDYFKKIGGPKLYQNNSIQNLQVIKEKNEIIRFEQQLISTYLDKGQIDLIDISDILVNTHNIEVMSSVAQDITDEGNLSIDIEQRYVIGYLFACYLLDRIKDNPKNVKEFFELNEMLNYYDILDFLDYLELDIKEDTDLFDLTEESYKKLEKSYVKRLKRLTSYYD